MSPEAAAAQEERFPTEWALYLEDRPHGGRKASQPEDVRSLCRAPDSHSEQ